MLVLLLLAAVSQPVDPRISHPWELTVSVEQNGKTYTHTETYWNLDECSAEEQQLEQVSEAVPDISVYGCDYIGLT